MNNDIRESLARLEQIKPADVGGIDNELATLQTAVRKEIETQTSVVNTADLTDPAYSIAANDLVGLLQLSQAAADGRAEVTKLVYVAGKVMGRVLKKAPK